MRQNPQVSDNKAEDIEFIDVFLDESEVLPSEPKKEEDICEEDTKSNSIAKTIFSYVMIIAAATVAAFAINYFVIFNAHVPTTSMVPTVNVDDRLIGFRLAYLFSEPARGDIIIFEHKCYDAVDAETLIKRVIGLPGDTIEIIDGQVLINGSEIVEDYIAEPMLGNFGPYTVPPKEYFVMGDNRNVSDDARYWNDTFVSRDEIIAKAVFKYYPSFKTIK